MHTKFFTAFMVVASSLFSCHAHSLTLEQNQALQKTFDENLLSIRNTVVNASLSEMEKIIFEKTKIELDWADELEAYATIDKGDRKVYLSTGLLYTIQNIKATEIHSAIIPGDTCYFDYQRYLYSEISAGKTSLGRLLSPEKAAETKCICKGFSLKNMMASPTWRLSVRNGSLLGSLFIILHEIGHHVNGDVLKPQNGDISAEMNADRWALQTAGKAGFVLQPATGVFGLLLALESASDVSISQKRARFDALTTGLIALLKDKSIPRHLPDYAYDDSIRATNEYSQWIGDTLSQNLTIEDSKCDTIDPTDYEKITTNNLHKNNDKQPK